MFARDSTTTIEPRRGFSLVDVSEIWKYRELLLVLAWRDIKVRYKQTVLGTGWAVIQPVLSMVVFTVFFGALLGTPSDGVPYPLFVFSGLLPWTFVSNGINRASTSLVGESHMISRIYFPRLIVPVSSYGAGFLDFVISGVIMIPLMVYYGVAPTHQLWMLPVLVCGTALLALGAGTLLSAVNVVFRDVKYVTPFLIQIWLYVSPVIYPVTIVPQRWRWLLALNPMTGVIAGYRSALFGRPFPWTEFLASVLVSAGVLIVALWHFRRVERTFADVI